MNFKITILWITITTAALTLLYFFRSVFNSTKISDNKEWASSISNCPDYWTDLAGNGSKCLNPFGMGKNASTTEVVDFTSLETYILRGKQLKPDACGKYRWAQEKGVAWDGITNASLNPCTIPTLPS